LRFSPSAATQEIGRKWTAEFRSAVLRVPSAIVPAEWIYVLNPKHPDFRRIEFLTPAPFGFDLRLK
jgi:RES domain-containing protein